MEQTAASDEARSKKSSATEHTAEESRLAQCLLNKITRTRSSNVIKPKTRDAVGTRHHAKQKKINKNQLNNR